MFGASLQPGSFVSVNLKKRTTTHDISIINLSEMKKILENIWLLVIYITSVN